jgi:hypothetical protein
LLLAVGIYARVNAFVSCGVAFTGDGTEATFSGGASGSGSHIDDEGTFADFGVTEFAEGDEIVHKISFG